jgi:Amt family ammonium transporter
MDNELSALNIIFTEAYYWITVVMMFLIHVGFCVYEVGVSRYKNHQHTLDEKYNVDTYCDDYFLFLWLVDLLSPSQMDLLSTGVWKMLLLQHPIAQEMAPNMSDHIMGVFWAAFLLFSWTAASIVSGATIERIRTGAFLILAALIGSVCWIIDAAWGWHYGGWMVQLLGYHDAYASGVIHGIAGGFALGVVMVLGPRIGKFNSDGSANTISPRNPWMITIGLFLIYTGFWGFYAACNVPIYDAGSDYGGGEALFTATNIYLQPTTLSGITINFLMSLSGGLMVGYLVSKGDAFWTYSLGLAGIIGASCGNDVYHPYQAMIIAGVVAYFTYKLHFWVENTFKIDDAVGAIAVHGYAGTIGLLISGFVLWGMPATPYGDAVVTPWGQAIGAFIMFFVLGFVPAWIASKILDGMGLLRIPREVELAGLDILEMEQRAADDAQFNKAERSA